MEPPPVNVSTARTPAAADQSGARTPTPRGPPTARHGARGGRGRAPRGPAATGARAMPTLTGAVVQRWLPRRSKRKPSSPRPPAPPDSTTERSSAKTGTHEASTPKRREKPRRGRSCNHPRTNGAQDQPGNGRRRRKQPAASVARVPRSERHPGAATAASKKQTREAEPRDTHAGGGRTHPPRRTPAAVPPTATSASGGQRLRRSARMRHKTGPTPIPPPRSTAEGPKRAAPARRDDASRRGACRPENGRAPG